jgi:multidrug efflux pump subunit AcrA (membrane-fusion protein)
MPPIIARWRSVHFAVALAVIVGIAAGYGAIKFYQRPFDTAAAAAPKIPAVSPPATAVTPAQLPSATTLPIPVVKPRTQSVRSYVEITGNAASVNAVKLIARVEGYLDQIHYEDGQFVKKRRPPLHDTTGPV